MVHSWAVFYFYFCLLPLVYPHFESSPLEYYNSFLQGTLTLTIAPNPNQSLESW